MSSLIDLAFISAEAMQRADDYDAFVYFVELDDRSDEDLDALIETVAAPIVEAINCMDCANCCRNLDVFLTESDSERLAAGTFIPLDELLVTTIDREQAADVEEWGVFRDHPCRFLDGTVCSIYAHRPESCRMYPQFTPDFRWTMRQMMGGVGLCPIIYHVIEALQKELSW